MEKKKKDPSNLNTSTETAGQKFWREFQEMPYSTDRIGQIAITISGRHSAETKNSSEKNNKEKKT